MIERVFYFLLLLCRFAILSVAYQKGALGRDNLSKRGLYDRYHTPRPPLVGEAVAYVQA